MTKIEMPKIDVMIERNRNGWYVARCDALPGLFVAHENRDAVVADVPAAIAALYQADHGQEIAKVKIRWISAIASG